MEVLLNKLVPALDPPGDCSKTLRCGRLRQAPDPSGEAAYGVATVASAEAGRVAEAACELGN